MIAVLDASAAIELLLERPQAHAIRTILAEADCVLAPDLFVPEVTNALWKYLRAGAISVDDAQRAAETAVQLVDEFTSSHILQREALSVAHAWSHPVYDAVYIVLARRNAASLITMDTRLRSLASSLQISVLDND